jgi:uncharacterized membrane protein YfcA
MSEAALTFLPLLFLAGFAAGVCNAVAGGGTLISFPVFLAAGLPPVVANASNAIAVWPGHALALIGYRAHLAQQAQPIKASLAAALAGGITGALLLSQAGDALFARLIPPLLLAATLLFAYGEAARRWLQARAPDMRPGQSGWRLRSIEFVLAVYGGFFGAGLGVMLMAGLMMLGVRDLQANNALKNLLACVITSVAAAVFAVSGLVSWPETGAAFAGAMIGGVAGGHWAKRLPASLLRRLVIVTGCVLTLYYAWKYYG